MFCYIYVLFLSHINCKLNILLLMFSSAFAFRVCVCLNESLALLVVCTLLFRLPPLFFLAIKICFQFSPLIISACVVVHVTL